MEIKLQKQNKGMKTVNKPPSQVKCPRPDLIGVVGFQFFDNGEKPGKGRSRHVVKLEVHCEARYVPSKPYWKRSVSMLEPKTFFDWIDGQVFEPKVAKLYAETRAVVDQVMDHENTEWIKLGHIEDTRLRDRYPGQFVIVMKLKDGPLHCSLQLGESLLDADAMYFNKAWRKGSRARLFSGTYDPFKLYEQSKVIAAKEAAVPARETIPEGTDDLLAQLGWML